MTKKIAERSIVLLILIFSLGLLAGCGTKDQVIRTTGEEGANSGEIPGELVIYSARKEQFVQPVIAKFEQETGIEVKLLTLDESAVNKILEEKNNVQADIFFSNDTGAMEYLRIQGALQANASPSLAVIDDKFKALDGSWIGLSARSRILMYNKDLISEEQMPKTLEELADPKWKGQFMITRGGNGSMVAQIAALRTAWGDEKTKEWIRGIAANAGAITNGHGDIRKAVGAGEFKFGLVNNYYYHQQLLEEKDNNVGAVYPDQGPEGMGVFVNAAGLALIQGAPNLDNAKLFIDFMLKPDQQKMFVGSSYEVPLSAEIEAAELEGLLKINEYNLMEMPLHQIGPVWEDVRKLIEEAGLALNV